jgi:hypothetical protein
MTWAGRTSPIAGVEAQRVARTCEAFPLAGLDEYKFKDGMRLLQQLIVRQHKIFGVRPEAKSRKSSVFARFRAVFCFSDVKKCYNESRGEGVLDSQRGRAFSLYECFVQEIRARQVSGLATQDGQIDDIARNSYVNTFLEAR